jgi:hypothetical protein
MVDPARRKKKHVFVLVGVILFLGAMAGLARFVTPNKLQVDWYPSVPVQEGKLDEPFIAVHRGSILKP